MELETCTRTLVSIITPVLNQQAFIKQTVDSILGQDYPDIEYIVVDGGSTDGTLKILEQYDDRITLITEPDKGQADAINKGFHLSRGEIVAWLNADDIYLPGAVSAIVEAFAANPEVVCVYGDCSYVDPLGEVLSRYPAKDFDLGKLVLESENFIPQPATFFLKTCLDSAGYLDEELDYVLDYELWLRFSEVGKFYYLTKKLAHTRLHPGAKSVMSFARFGEEMVTVIKRVFEKSDLPDEILAEREQAVSHAYLRAAHAAFWAGDMDSAYKHSGSAAPENLSLRKKLTRGYIRGISHLERWGFPISKILRRSRKNPYTLFFDLKED